MPYFKPADAPGFDYTISRRKRKTMEIRVEAPGKVLLLVPEKSKEEDINRMLTKHAGWVIKKLEDYQGLPDAAEHAFGDGEQFWLQGQPVFLEIIHKPGAADVNVTMEGDRIRVISPVYHPEFFRFALVDWFKQRCQEAIMERVSYYEPLIKKTPLKVCAKEQKKRWGSCTATGHLYFNWRLIGAPPEVLNYVVVHEMCHLVHLDHSPAFWNLVRTFLPDYKNHQKWLRVNGKMLYF